MTRIRIFVLSGWFGRGLSPGMKQLADQLKPYGETSYHPWNDTAVVPDINTEPLERKIAVIGYSLGANQLGYINRFLRPDRTINLGVAYDPSKQSPLVISVTNDQGQREYIQTATHFNRILCYYHPNAWFYGGSRYIGLNVETTEINTPHLAVQFSNELHGRTMVAVRELA